jgi:tRNA-uridine 2-sulfurtransferase
MTAKIRKGIHLYSGGLDSLLSAKLLIDQGIDLVGLHFVLPFFAPDFDEENSAPAVRARRIGLKLRFVRCGEEYMKMAQNPPHGFGSHMNPCIDCKIFFMRHAAEIMRSEGASFVSTGEVIGQRPMSQKRDMMTHILKVSGLEGRLLRPLSALKLKPTIPETEGIVDRSKLLDVSGRGRYRQIELAHMWGITDYAAPAGGCLFTDPIIAKRIKDLYRYHPAYSMNDLYLLSFGRHFRLNEKTRFMVSRNEEETLEIEKYKNDADLFMWPDFAGPCIYLVGGADDTAIVFLTSIITRYGKPGKNGTTKIFARRKGFDDIIELDAAEPASDKVLESMRI